MSQVWRIEASNSTVDENGNSIAVERSDEEIADMLDSADPRLRLEGAKAVLHRLFGPPPEAHELDDED
jgi:hypothetical protein